MIAQRKSAWTIRRLAAVLLAASVFVVVARTADRASAQGAVKSVHGDWQIRCDTPPGAQGEQCALMQSVTAEDRPNIGLTVIVLKTSDQKSRLMRVVAPLGVLLPSGLGLKIDNQDVGNWSCMLGLAAVFVEASLVALSMYRLRVEGAELQAASKRAA